MFVSFSFFKSAPAKPQACSLQVDGLKAGLLRLEVGFTDKENEHDVVVFHTGLPAETLAMLASATTTQIEFEVHFNCIRLLSFPPGTSDATTGRT